MGAGRSYNIEDSLIQNTLLERPPRGGPHDERHAHAHDLRAEYLSVLRVKLERTVAADGPELDYTFNGVGLLRYFFPGFIKETVRPFDSRTFDFSEGKDTISDLLKWAEECEKRV